MVAPSIMSVVWMNRKQAKCVRCDGQNPQCKECRRGGE